MIELTLTSNAAAIAKRIGETPKRLDAAERSAIVKASQLVLRAVRKRFVPYTGASKAKDGLLQRRTGHLSNSSNASAPEKRPGGWQARVGYRKGVVEPYAKMTEFGGTVTAKGKLLAIPVAEGLTPAGVARYRSPREVEGGFWKKSEGGQIVFLKPRGKRGKLFDLLFVGKKSVKVPAAGVLSRSLKAERSDIVRLIERETAAALNARSS